MTDLVLDKEDALEIIFESDDVVRNKIIGTSRWSVHHEVIFKKDGKFYKTTYSVGATEQQDEQPFEYDKEVVCKEVERIEKTVYDYKEVPS